MFNITSAISWRICWPRERAKFAPRWECLFSLNLSPSLLLVGKVSSTCSRYNYLRSAAASKSIPASRSSSSVQGAMMLQFMLIFIIEHSYFSSLFVHPAGCRSKLELPDMVGMYNLAFLMPIWITTDFVCFF